MRTELTKAVVRRLVGQRPFRPFILNLENGDRITIEHPENIAFDPVFRGDTNGSGDFYVLSRNLRFFGTLDVVTSVVLADTGE